MTAENEHKLSIRLLSNVALGRGSQISLDIVKKNKLFYFLISSYYIPLWVYLLGPLLLTENIIQSNFPLKTSLNSVDVVMGTNYKLNPPNSG